MEVTFIAAVGVSAHALLHIRLHLQSGMDYQRATRLYELRVMAEALQVSLLCPVDIEVIRIGSCDNTHPRTKPMERAVELVGLNDDIVALVGQDIVGAVVLGDTTEESIAVDMTLMHDMCTHCRCRCLSMCTCHAESLMCTGQYAEHLRTFLNLKAILTEVSEFLVCTWYGRSEHHECGLRITACIRNLFHIILVMKYHSFLLKSPCQGSRRLVITGNDETLVIEVAGDGTHANTADTHEIY